MSVPSRTAAALLVLAGVILAQSGNFEICVPGPALAGCASEGWTSAPGAVSGLATVTVVPHGGIAGPVAGFPTSGTQWAVVSAANGGGFLAAPPPGGPAPYPFAPGSTGNLVFPAVVLGAAVSFDWTFVTPECPMDAVYNDFVTIDLVDPATGLPLANLLYRDTFSASLAAPALAPAPTGTVASPFCPSAGTLEEAPPGTAKTSSFTVPAALVGTVANLEVHVGNAFDNGYASYLHLDQVVMTSAAAFAIVLSSPLGPGSLQIDDLGLTPGGPCFNFFTLNEPCPNGPGTGPFAGLCTANPALLLAQAMLPFGTAPFSFTAAGASRSFGPLAGLPSGLVIEAVAFDPLVPAFSPVARHTIP